MKETILPVIPVISMSFVIIFATFLLPDAAAMAAYRPGEQAIMSYEEMVGRLHSNELYRHLQVDGYVKSSVDLEDFDTIFVLAEQFTKEFGTDQVDLPLILSMIAHESGFDKDAKNGNAVGLMQVLPQYHMERLASYLEEGEEPTVEHFYDPRYSIAVGIDYMVYICSETKDDLAYALMWYNQGAVSACEDHENNGYTSRYANSVLTLRDIIKDILK